MSEYKINEIKPELYEIDIDGELVLINIAGTSIQKDLENMDLIKEGDKESFHGYLIKSAKKWIATKTSRAKTNQMDLL